MYNKIKLFSGKITERAEKIYLEPEVELPSGIQILRSGILLGEVRKNRFVPEHSLFMCPFIECENTLNLKLDDKRVEAFLHGEEIECTEFSGYGRVSVDGIPLGFGKASNARLKNYYPKGLRKL